TMAMKPASLLASRMPCFQTFSCACAAVKPAASAMAANANVLCTDESSRFDGFVWPEAKSSGIRVQYTLDSVLCAALPTLIDVQEQVLRLRPCLDQPLLVRIAHQRLEHLAVLLRKPVLPRIDAEQAFLLFPGVAVPGKRHDAGVCHALHRDRFCLVERPKQIDGEPWVLVGKRLAQAEHVHDRENSGALEIGHLFALWSGKRRATRGSLARNGLTKSE